MSGTPPPHPPAISRLVRAREQRGRRLSYRSRPRLVYRHSLQLMPHQTIIPSQDQRPRRHNIACLRSRFVGGTNTPAPRGRERAAARRGAKSRRGKDVRGRALSGLVASPKLTPSFYFFLRLLCRLSLLLCFLPLRPPPLLTSLLVCMYVCMYV